jgi:small-conductance mechanosensitive channel
MVGSFARRLIAAALVAFAALAANPADAQGPRPSETVAAAPDVKAARSRLDGFRAELDQKERALQARELPDPELQRLRQQLDPVAEGIRALIDDLAPRLDTTRARLEQLGPKPKDGQPEESADAAKERAEREAAVAELDETQRLGRALLVQAEQLRTLVSDRRRAGFTRALFEQSTGILNPDLWLDVVQAIPRELWVLQTVLTDAAGWLQRRATFGSLLLVGLAVGAAIALYAGRRHVAPGSWRGIPPPCIPQTEGACWPHSPFSCSGRCRLWRVAG